jgi:DNA-binding transcriptional ArsR family regulator
MASAAQILFQTLADPTRRGLFEQLAQHGEHTVHALTALAGVSQPAVSKHLRLLKFAGLIIDRRDGRQTYYRALPQALLPLVEWMALFTRDTSSDLRPVRPAM